MRVTITLARTPLLDRALDRRLRSALSGTPSGDQLRTLRSRRVHGLASEFERRRHQALESTELAADSASLLHEKVDSQVRAHGGRVVEHDILTGSLTALVPGTALASVAGLADVAAVELTAEERALGLDISTASVGAPSFWAAGYLGGTGPADTAPVDLAILHDKIEEDHPAFAGVTFQRPSDAPRGTSCGQLVNGCEHGTEVASMAISRGVSACEGCVSADASNTGVAKGLDSVLDAQASGMADDTAWALGIGSFGVDGASDPAEVLSNSHGSVAEADDSSALQASDKVVSAFGTLIAYPSGNAGPARSVNKQCIAYNGLCIGGFDHRGTVDPADDVIEDFSSRGPTPGGRKKPDLVAVATSEFANQHWIRDGRLWSGGSGTSLAAPQGAAAAALLAGSGIAAPIAQKAILINSARQGRATPTSAMGTQSGWQPDWGWGALDLDSALGERTHFYMRDVDGGDAHFYRATAQAAGDRATLVWNRRAVGCIAPGCNTTALTLSNLELEQLDPQTGAVEGRSASAIDNVEQVRSPGTGEVIYKVKAASTVDGLPGEPYALAARRLVTPLVTPRPTVNVTLSTATTRPGDPVQVMAEIRNPSPDLSAEGAQATLALPPGVELAAGSNPPTQPLGSLAPNATAVLAWTVRASGDAANRITVNAGATRYGETFTATDGASFNSDGSPPTVSIGSPAGRTSDTMLSVTWTGSDGGVGVRDYDVDVSVDGGPYAPWLTATTSRSATYPGTAGHRYRFRVRATDRLGTASPYVASDEAAVVTPGSDGPVLTPVIPPTTKASPALRVRSVKRSGARVVIAGTISPYASRRLTFDVRGSAAKRRVRQRAQTFPVAGRFKLSLRLPRRLTGTLTVRYEGDDTLAAGATRLKLRKL